MHCLSPATGEQDTVCAALFEAAPEEIHVAIMLILAGTAGLSVRLRAESMRETPGARRLARPLFYHNHEGTKVMTIMRQDGSVEFRFFRPEARDVRVAGDFNGWCGDALHMKPAGNGWWTARAILGSGEYRFRYVADGRWFTDYASNGVEFAKLGLNSLLIVPKQERTKTTSGNGEVGSRTECRPSQQRDNATSVVV